MSAKEVSKKKEAGILRIVLVLTAICVFMALCLGLINHVTEPAIAINKDKTIQEALKEVLPADGYDPVDGNGGEESVDQIYRAGEEGFVVQVTPTSGFSGAITMMVGISTDGAITGISIIEHAETSGLGSNATKPEWQEKFVGTTEEVAVDKDGGKIPSLTGSTITSRAVCDGVNAARRAVAEIA